MAQLDAFDPLVEDVVGLIHDLADAPEQRAEESDRLSARLGIPSHELHWARAGREAGADTGRIFCTAQVAGVLWLSIRDDGLVAYLSGFSGRAVPSSQRIQQFLTAVGLCDVTVPSLKRLRTKSPSGLRRWVRVASGREPQPAAPERLELIGATGEEVSIDDLALASIELDALLSAEAADPCAAEGLSIPTVNAGQPIARLSPGHPGQDGVDVFGCPLPAPVTRTGSRVGEGIEEVEREYRATRHGYLTYLNGRLSVSHPVWIDPDWVEAFWVLLDGQPSDIDVESVTRSLSELGVCEGILEDRIEELVRQRRAGRVGCGKHLVARGKRPVDGRDAVLEISLPTERQSGKERPDGSIDFREVNYTANVKAGQEVARFSPAIRGQPGRSLRGEPLPAKDGNEGLLEAGDHVRVESIDGSSQRFIATIDGALRLDGDRISVVELLRIEGDVSYATGNLRFAGEVHVRGSVVQGFSIKAGGDVTVSETIEANALVASLGDVVVGRGIHGRRTKVAAKGSLRAQFAQEATLLAGGDLELGSFAYHAHLRAGGQIRVLKGVGRLGGSLVGGEAWAMRGIEAHQAGSEAEPHTLLCVGLLPDQAKQLTDLQRRLEDSERTKARLLSRFNLSEFDMGAIRNRIASATGPHRRLLANTARQIGLLAGERAELSRTLQELRDQLQQAAARGAILVVQSAHPGVEVKVGSHARKLSEEVTSPRFHLREDELVER